MSDDAWILVSFRLADDSELLMLREPNGKYSGVMYAPGRVPFEGVWHAYYYGFPKQEFDSREAVLRDALRQANGKPLLVRDEKGRPL